MNAQNMNATFRGAAAQFISKQLPMTHKQVRRGLKASCTTREPHSKDLHRFSKEKKHLWWAVFLVIIDRLQLPDARAEQRKTKAARTQGCMCLTVGLPLRCGKRCCRCWKQQKKLKGCGYCILASTTCSWGGRDTVKEHARQSRT